jgi:membrane protease subunit HflC
VKVDSFVKWRITDVRQFYVSVAQRGDPTLAAESRISQTVNDALRAEFARRKVHDVVSGERDKIMADVTKKVDADVRRIGVQVVDVRLKRVDFVDEVTSDVYRRMESERKRAANEERAKGQAEGERIKAEADRMRQVIVAEAYREAQKVKARATRRPPASTRRRSSAIPSSTASIAAWKRTGAALAARAT